MTLEQALYSYLSGYAGLTALVGTRIYPVTMPQGVTYPAVTYRKVSGLAEYVLGQHVPELYNPRYQFDAWGTSYSSVKSVAEQIKAALGGYSGLMGGASGVRVIGSWIVNEIDLYESDTGVYHTAVDVRFYHE